MNLSLIVSLFLCLFCLSAIAFEEELSLDFITEIEGRNIAPDNWQNLDFESDEVLGTSVEKVHQTYLIPANEVIVAVIDTGVDINHKDLQGKIWINQGEIPNNGIDDDNNGYIDDVAGWNFLGSPKGMASFEINNQLVSIKSKSLSEQLMYDDKVDTRYLRILLKTKLSKNLTRKQQKDFNELFPLITGKREKALAFLKSHLDYLKEMKFEVGFMQALGLKEISKESLLAFDIDMNNTQQIQVMTSLLERLEQGASIEKLESKIKEFDIEANYFYNYVEDPRVKIVGDNPQDLTEKNYGNNDVKGPDSDHGTSVAGIIAAIRDNGIGIQGINQFAKIMPIRAISRGDERDKDVANAIYYAVNNGAKIINISFGKYRSIHKKTVDTAIKYAEEKNVIIINSAGNEGIDTDETIHFPNDLMTNGQRLSNMITVGASSTNIGSRIFRSFSNYGQSSVDIMAPGVGINTTISENSYSHQNGTSFSTPIVTGIISLLISINPEISTRAIKDILLQSVTRYPGLEVFIPKKHYLSELSRSGGIVNAFNAVSVIAIEKPTTEVLASN